MGVAYEYAIRKYIDKQKEKEQMLTISSFEDLENAMKNKIITPEQEKTLCEKITEEIKLAPVQLTTDNTVVVKNNVEHPSHYNREGSMECIDEMLMIFGREAVLHFCLLNCWKYRYRAADKNGAEDLAKSDWYLAKYKELKFPENRPSPFN